MGEVQMAKNTQKYDETQSSQNENLGNEVLLSKTCEIVLPLK